MSRQRWPREPSSMASARPTGPAPTIRTGEERQSIQPAGPEHTWQRQDASRCGRWRMSLVVVVSAAQSFANRGPAEGREVDLRVLGATALALARGGFRVVPLAGGLVGLLG